MRALAVMAVLLVGCGGTSPDGKLAKSLDAPASWMASLAMIGEKWSANSVPRAFVEKSLDAADEELAKTSKSTRESDASPRMREAVLTKIAAAQRASGEMRRALGRNDRNGVRGPVQTLKAAGEQLAAIAEAAEESSP